MENFNPFELAGYSKEDSEELIRICDECGVSYSIMISALRPLKRPTDAEKTIREFNSRGYNY